MEKKINELLIKLRKEFRDHHYDLTAFARNLTDNDKVTWYKGEPYHFVSGYKKEYIPAKDPYSCQDIKEYINIGDSIFNPYDVYILSKSSRSYYSWEYNQAFIMGNFMLHWNNSVDKLSLFIKNNKENFKPCLNGFEVERSLLKAEYRKWDENDRYKSSKYNKELYAFITVIYDEFLKYLKK